MCRDRNHAGGRSKVRCDCDTSAARQARRLRARSHAEYSSGTASASEDVTLIASTAPAATQVSIARVNELKDEIRQLDVNYSTLPYHKDDEGNFIYEVGDREFTSKVDAMLYTNELLEAKTVEAGSVVSALATERSGVTPEQIQDFYTAELARLQDLVDRGIKEDYPPEQQAQLDAAAQKIEDSQLAIDAYEAAHIDDYQHETLSSFFGKLQAHIDEHPDDEEAKAKYAEHDALWDAHQKAQVAKVLLEDKFKKKTVRDPELAYRALKSDYGKAHPVIGEMLKKRSDAYLEVLSEIRQMGGVELKTVGNPRRGALDVLNEALRYYPADWIEASNRLAASRPLRIKSTTKRAHYSSGSKQTKNVRMPSLITTIEKESWEPRSSSIHDQGAIIVRPENPGPRGGYASYSLPNGYTYEAYCDNGEVMVVRPDLQVNYGYGSDTKPSGSGWKQITTKHKLADGTEVEVTDWARQRTRLVESTTTTEAEITISPRSGGFQGESGFSVALHEFAHRVEAVGPSRISRIESAFLQRRAKQSAIAAGKAEAQLSTIYKHTSEKGYEDEFADHYMGKVYEGDTHKEIFSTGMEALFAGSFGGLAGTAGRRRDDDMQQLILGLLATA